MSETGMEQVERLLRPLETVDWRNVVDTREATTSALMQMSGDRELLGWLIRSLADDPVRFARCERDNQIQLLLFDAPSGNYRVRLHVMPENMYDYPHGHRYSFGSMVLSGTLEQTLFAALDWGEEPISPNPLAITSFTVRCGETYALNYPVVHKVRVVSAPVVTLFIRSAALKYQASNLDTVTGEHRWQRGASTGTSEGQHQPLTLAELAQTLDCLSALNII
jgi:hypothetical protein